MKKARASKATKRKATPVARSSRPRAKQKQAGDAKRSGLRPETKQALLISLLEQVGGATLHELVEATSWLPHTTRAALTRLRQKGVTLNKSKAGDGKTTYRIANGAPAAARKASR